MKKFTVLTGMILCLCSASLNVYAIEEHDGDADKLFEPVKIQDGSVLSVFECAAAAIQNSPEIRRSKYNLDIAKSGLGIAKSVYFPSLYAGAGFYNENNSTSTYHDMHYQELPNVRVAVNQLIYNFGKSSAFIKMEEFNKIAAEYEFMDSICEALFDVKEKYYKMLRAKALVDAESRIADNINEHFFKIASKQPDKYIAGFYLKRAQAKVIEAEKAYKNAKIDLANAMYLDKDYDFTIKNTPSFNYSNNFKFSEKYPDEKSFEPVIFDFDRDEAVNTAYKNSPDLKILVSVKKAMENSLKYIKRTYLPDLRGEIGYEYGNIKAHGEERASNSGLKIGVNLSSEVNIKELYHSIKGADAQLKAADNEIDLFKQNLFYEVKRAFNNLDKSLEKTYTAKEQAEYAFYALKTVEEKYRKNEIPCGAVQSAGKDYMEAEENYIDSLYNYNAAVIQIEKAMHIHAADIHHKSEHALRHHADELIEHLNKALSCRENEKNRHKDLEEDL